MPEAKKKHNWKPPQPKFKVQARRYGDNTLPVEVRDEVRKPDAEKKADAFALKYPGMLIEMRLLTGFRHGKPLRWTYNRLDKKLLPVAWYDATAIGKKSPVGKRVEMDTLFDQGD